MYEETIIESDDTICRWYMMWRLPHEDDSYLELEDEWNDEHTVIRYCVYSYKDNPDDYFLSDLWVKPHFRNKGFGNEMLQKVGKFVKQADGKAIYLRVEKETWMHDWYERNGFEDFDSDGLEVWMKKEIDNDTEI